MKNFTLTLLLSSFSLLATAQTFDEKAFEEVMQSFQKDLVGYLKTNAAPDYTFTSNGEVMDAKALIKRFETYNVRDWTVSNLKVRQYGTAAFATGTVNHSYISKVDGSTLAYTDLFSYTFAYQGGKWLILGGQHSDIPLDQMKEETAIKKRLDDVDAAFNGGDKDGVINAWKNDPKISFIGSGAGGEFNIIAQDFEGLKKAITQYVVKPTGAKGIKSNHRFIFKGNIA